MTEFWRMVWQEKACCIVMLTKTFDFIKVGRSIRAFCRFNWKERGKVFWSNVNGNNSLTSG